MFGHNRFGKRTNVPYVRRPPGQANFLFGPIADMKDGIELAVLGAIEIAIEI
jgi:hypothetical protein